MMFLNLTIVTLSDCDIKIVGLLTLEDEVFEDEESVFELEPVLDEPDLVELEPLPVLLLPVLLLPDLLLLLSLESPIKPSIRARLW